jgi:DSF synthase
MTASRIASDAYLLGFSQIDVEIDREFGIVWVYLKPKPRPCFNPTMISEIRRLQIMLETYGGKLPYQGELVPIHYHVLDSRTPGMFSMGGDLDLFCDHVRRRDREGLLKYARSCIDTMHAYMVGFGAQVTTISLLRGDALGGGFEVALSGNVIIAEEHVELGFPEILFNTFPGMGSYHLLSQRIPPLQVDRIMLNGKRNSAAEMYETGIVDRLAPTRRGAAAVYDFVEENRRHRNGYLAVQHVRQKVHPISYEDLLDVVTYWVDTTMQATEKDLKLMQRLVRAQDRRETSIQQESLAA